MLLFHHLGSLPRLLLISILTSMMLLWPVQSLPANAAPPSTTDSGQQPAAIAPSRYAQQVMITEIMAAPNEERGSSALRDEDGEIVDWIEIYNASNETVDLSGWYLTDRSDDLIRWKFPAGILLAAQSYLLVFASEKDRASVGQPLHTNFALKREGEYLALVDADWHLVSAITPLYPTQYTSVSFGLDRSAEAASHYTNRSRYFVQPTPGASNPADLSPVITSLSHEPKTLDLRQNLTVRATITSPLPIHAVTLHYRIGFEAERAISMTRSTDVTFLATLPTSSLPAGTLVRYVVSAESRNSVGGLWRARWPLERPPVDPAQPDYVRAPNYFGTVIGYTHLDQESDLPVFHWFVEEAPSYGWEWFRPAYDAHVRAGNPAWSFEDPGTSAVVFYDGQLYDNVWVKLRGKSNKVFSKKSLKFEFNSNFELRLRGSEMVGESFNPERTFDIMNLNTTAADESYIRQPLAWQAYSRAGVPHSVSFSARVQQNGKFFSVSAFVEQVHTGYLERNGLSGVGTVFKADYNALGLRHFDAAFGPLDGMEQRRPLPHSRIAALADFIHGINLDPANPAYDRAAVTAYVFDHVDVPTVINYMATRTVLNDYDTSWHNYYLYQDRLYDPTQPDDRLWVGTGEWLVLPWDKDHIFGLNAEDPQLVAHPFFGAQGHDIRPNALMDAIIQSPPLQQMYLRRLRSVMDLLLGTEAANSWLDQHAQQLFNLMTEEAPLDTARWNAQPVPATDVPITAFDPQGLHDQIELRRRELYGPSEYSTFIPASQQIRTLQFGMLEVGSAPTQAAISLLNCHSEAIDISGWSLVGADNQRYTFKPGVVLPGHGGRLYVTPDVNAFRAVLRQKNGTATAGVFVQGGFEPTLLGRLDGSALIPAPLNLMDGAIFIGTNTSPIENCAELFLPLIAR